jgi:hypothetical protein
MARSRSRSPLAFPAVLMLTLAVALLPRPWRQGWQPDLAQIVQIPFKPFTHAIVVATGWLRPEPSPLIAIPPEERDLAQALEDRDLARSLFHRERRRADELQEQLRQLQLLPPETRRVTTASVIAHITSRSASSPMGPVELRLRRGAAEPIPPNTVAVYAGVSGSSVHVLGRTVGEPSRTSCSLLPLGHPAAGGLRGLLVPADRPLDPGQMVFLQPAGGGAFSAQIDREIPVGRGDIVRLDDPGWSRAAQGLIVGRVMDVKVNDVEPLRHAITIRPAFHIDQVAYVTLLVERETAGDAGADGGERPRAAGGEGGRP